MDVPQKHQKEEKYRILALLAPRPSTAAVVCAKVIGIQRKLTHWCGPLFILHSTLSKG